MKKRILGAVFILCALLFFFPVLASLTNSLMTPGEIGERYGDMKSISFSIIPSKVSLTQYFKLLSEDYAFLAMFWNSVKYAVVITVFGTAFALPTAFAFAKIKFPCRDTLFFIYIVVMMMPFQVTVLPNYLLLKFLGLLNTPYALILPGVFSPFQVFLFRQFIKAVPDEAIEAVSLESSSITVLFKTAVIPAIKPGIMALMVLTFAESWNMVEQPLIFVEDNIHRPLSIMLSIMGESSRGTLFAGSTIFLMPMILLYFYFEEQIVQGISRYRW